MRSILFFYNCIITILLASFDTLTQLGVKVSALSTEWAEFNLLVPHFLTVAKMHLPSVVIQDWVPECPNVKKINKGGLGQYGPEHFEV